MVDTEEYFPRGGKKPISTYFKQNENFLGSVQKGEKKKKKLKRKTEDDDGYLSEELVQEVDQSQKICGIWFGYKVVKEGQLLLGRIWKVHETKVHVTLPCRMLGVVMACHISEAYNKMLEAYVNDQIEKVKELSEMFHPGQYVVVKVLEVESSRLMLSMMPQHVNSTRTQADLHKGALLQAAVSSVEDHGYVMDIGIPNTRAFLPRGLANPEVELDTGMLSWVTIKSLAAESGVLTLTSELEALQKAVQKKPAALLPGTALDFTIDKPLDNGIEGHVLDKTTAYIQRNHVDTVKGKKPGMGQRIRARLLYVVPPNNIPFLTMKNIFETTHPDLTLEQKLNVGDIIEEAQVIKIVGRSIYLKLGEGSIGILSLRRVTVHEDLTDEQVLLKSYPIGSTHKVRVLCYNLSDYVYSVSDDSSVLAEKYFKLSQFSVGDVVHATITAVGEKHLNVAVGRVLGFVQQFHMTETGIFIDPKKASNSKLPKKFKVGQEVKGRVLEVNTEKQLLQLTLKPSLLEPELEVLQSYEQAAVGRAYTGVIVHIKNYLLISFFNNVTAFVPKKWVSTEPLDNLADAFHLGQIVKCTILTVNPELKKICGSLTKAPFKGSDNWIGPRKRKINNQEFCAKKLKANDSENIKKHKKKQKDISPGEMKEIGDMDSQEPSKKKKRKNKELTEPPIDANNVNEIDTGESSPKKKKKNKKIDENNSSDNADAETIDTVKVSKKKKDKKVKESNIKPKEDSESDAIETDIYDDSDQVLTAQDWSFIDLTDCLTAKQYKKRIVALQKCMKERADRIESIEKNISSIEEKGLDAKNKKYHTAMHTERLVIQKQTEKLLEVLKIAQEKLKEFDVETNKDSKKKEKPVASSTDKEKVEHKQSVHRLKEVQVLDNLQPAVEVPSAKDFWSLDTNVLADKTKEEDSSSSEEEAEEKPKKKRKKLTVAERAAKAREEEERIREMEKRAIESENAPRSSDQFERALLAEPNCSQLWIAYMAFHLQATEIDKARAVGRKALNTINFREEGEKLNVWLALLNLEHRFGTKETQQKTLEDALQMNDPYEIHSKLLDILVDTSKPQELVSLVELMMRKYRARAAVYTACGQACFQAALRDKARQVMQKGIAALEKKEHVSLLVRFAQLERSHGDRERAEALFEQVLAVYPQRVDVCSAYVDMLIKAKDIDHVRQVMERMTSLQLPARKMKVLYKKWIEAEEKIGDASQAESVRQRAIQFIDKAKF